MLIPDSFKQDLRRMFPESVVFNVPLCKLSYWKIGGNADIWVSPKTVDEIAELRSFISQNGFPTVTLGSTSNLLFSDNGLRAIAIQIGSNFSNIEIENNFIKCQSGLWVPKLSRYALNAGLTGLEHICGIPGTVGGLVVMNGGSQRKGIGSCVKEIITIDLSGRENRYTNEEAKFKYRESIFQMKNEIIVELNLELESCVNKAVVRNQMLEILRSRNQKFPRKLPSCGSVFISDPALYENFGHPGKVIEDCGLKGLSHGKARISEKHANFIVNEGGAKASDIFFLVRKIIHTVELKTGHRMKSEVIYLDQYGEKMPLSEYLEKQ